MTKNKMTEPSSENIDNLDDKGYKNIFKNKEMFLEFLQSFVKEEWVNRIDASDMVRIDKEFILQDYRNKEADIVYKLKLQDLETQEKKEVIFYVLFELQSSVDRLMPYRLLMYMIQIWKEELKSIPYNDAQKVDFRLPAIVPIVLYNGKKNWSVPLSFKEILNETKSFGAHLVDFKYVLIDVNAYSQEELIHIANAISMIIMLDQSIVSRDKLEFKKRIAILAEAKNRITPEKFAVIFEWISKVFIQKLPEDIQDGMQSIIEGLKEGEDMTYALERLIDNLKNEGKLEGILEGKLEGRLEGKLEMIQKLLKKGMPIDEAAELAEIPVETVRQLKQN